MSSICLTLTITSSSCSGNLFSYMRHWNLAGSDVAAAVTAVKGTTETAGVAAAGAGAAIF